MGKNNVAESTRFPNKNGIIYLSECTNVDIDDQFMPHRRDGYPATPTLSAAGIHSLWADGDLCLFIQNGTLKRLNADYSATPLKADVGHARMNYVRPINQTYLTNDSIIGYVNEYGSYSDFPVPDQTYKTPMKPGHLIEWFNGRLYVARGDELWFSDPMAVYQTDERKNFKQMGGYISMIQAVRDGLYVSNLRVTFFLAGLDPHEAQLVKVADYPAILGTAIKADGERITRDISGRAVMWASPRGVCVGLDGGNFVNLTDAFYHPTYSGEGAAILRQVDNFFQILISQKS